MQRLLTADYHVHSNYSDGSFLEWMVRAAATADLEAVGIADHCMLSSRREPQAHRAVAGYNLDLTYERRREAIDLVADTVGIEVYDAVEMDYTPGMEEEIAEFLETASFEYTIGSVHEIDGRNVHFADHLRDKPVSTRRTLVDTYFNQLEALISSELFDIAAHPDIVERNTALRGLATESHYRQIATAFEDSRTIPELNAGRITEEYGQFHPNEPFLDILLEHDIPITVGSDSHDPESIPKRIDRLERAFETIGITPASPFDR